MIDVKTIFPLFDKSLINEIEDNATIQEFKAGDILMRTGQYIKNTVLVVKGKITLFLQLGPSTCPRKI